MGTYFALNRCLPIVAGFTDFFVAPVALTVRKGGVAHRRWGVAYGSGRAVYPLMAPARAGAAR